MSVGSINGAGRGDPMQFDQPEQSAGNISQEGALFSNMLSINITMPQEGQGHEWEAAKNAGLGGEQMDDSSSIQGMAQQIMTQLESFQGMLSEQGLDSEGAGGGESQGATDGAEDAGNVKDWEQDRLQELTKNLNELLGTLDDESEAEGESAAPQGGNGAEAAGGAAGEKAGGADAPEGAGSDQAALRDLVGQLIAMLEKMVGKGEGAENTNTANAGGTDKGADANVESLIQEAIDKLSNLVGNAEAA
ncbi:MAG: hypothetical protein WBB85_20515 [Albidovulum sp.]|uniref:hypothetical protein n=1 Tax=Albidovulum sp. TaxID=1872424 RepID=UPI003C954C3A